jgi:hypothetical protein
VLSADARSTARGTTRSLAQPAEIDVDNFDRVVARIAPRLLLGRDRDTALEFARSDDFHPDASIAVAVRGFREDAAGENPATLPPRPRKDADTFARLLGGAPPPVAARLRAAPRRSQALIREAVLPHRA